MKREQVPQDDENLMDGRGRELCYAVDENGNYVQVLSSGWAPKNAALLQAWEQINDEAREVLLQVKAGKVSPLAFFMARGMFDVKLLSDFTDIPKKKIKAHLEPDHFEHLDNMTLGKYAEAFNISVDELVNWSETADILLNKNWNEVPRRDSRRDGDE
ncbi:MAG: hypothetical protein C0394_05485 [Syntrophus sp. (in: bacteria)]|nr:hypothetical protein [Syntrophus sp. (in: bacteria)]